MQEPHPSVDLNPMVILSPYFVGALFTSNTLKNEEEALTVPAIIKLRAKKFLNIYFI
jgi:hypothetical protein